MQFSAPRETRTGHLRVLLLRRKVARRQRGLGAPAAARHHGRGTRRRNQPNPGHKPCGSRRFLGLGEGHGGVDFRSGERARLDGGEGDQIVDRPGFLVAGTAVIGSAIANEQRMCNGIYLDCAVFWAVMAFALALLLGVA